MNKKVLFSLIILIGCSAFASEPKHESDNGQWTTMDYLKQTTPWLRSQNIAGLQSVNLKTISEANVYFEKENGDFINYNGSDNSFKAGTNVESYYRLNEKIILTGEIDYSFFEGKNMGGSFLIDPYHAPFDLADYDGENKGNKRKEEYHIMGGISYKLNNHWVFGSKCNYKAMNYAKQKDLRHTNQLMDLLVSPAVIFNISNRLSIGTNYNYRKRSEGIVFKTYGTTDQIYHSLINYGGFWGTVEEFGNNGYTKGNEDKPLIDKYHGGDFQVSWDIFPKVNLLNEIGFKKRSGYYGIKSPSTVVYSRHEADILTYNARLSWKGNKTQHFINMNFEKESLSNYEKIYRYDNEGGGLQNVGYYGEMNSGNKKNWTFETEYTTHLKFEKGLPIWVIGAEYRLHKRVVNANLYPYYRNQNLTTNTFRLIGEYNLYKDKDNLAIGIATLYAKGNGNKAIDGVYTQPGESRIAPQEAKYMLNKEFEYLTNNQMRYSLNVKYSRKIKSYKVIGYCLFKYELAKAFNIQYLENDIHHCLTFDIGCKF